MIILPSESFKLKSMKTNVSLKALKTLHLVKMIPSLISESAFLILMSSADDVTKHEIPANFLFCKKRKTIKEYKETITHSKHDTSS